MHSLYSYKGGENHGTSNALARLSLRDPERRHLRLYAAGREQVSHVWVNGKPLLSDRQLTTLNTETLLGRSNDWQGRIRAGASN